MIRSNKFLISCISVVFLLALLTLIYCLHDYSSELRAENGSSDLPGIGALSDYEYPVNSSGQTYGIDWHGDNYDENAPDLVAAVGENDVEGYVKRTELQDEGDFVSSPQEALAYMEEKEALKQSGVEYRAINLYDLEGKNVIGEFRVYY